MVSIKEAIAIGIPECTVPELLMEIKVIPRTENLRSGDGSNSKWAAIERLPTSLRINRGLLNEGGPGEEREIDVRSMGSEERKCLMGRLLKVAENDNDKFLSKINERLERMALLLGLPGSGKTSLLSTLAGQLDSTLKASSLNGHSKIVTDYIMKVYRLIPFSSISCFCKQGCNQ
ncbi:hypothetical protein ABZP36_016156 [Zizania latifolia]